MTEYDRLIAGRYRLLEHLGRGAMGVVWRGHDEALDRMVAVKELAPYAGFDPAGAEQANRRVMREGRIAARLQHPNAVTVYSVVEEDGRPWLIMEYLSSRSLATVLAERGTLPEDEVARIGTQLASALAAAHAAGIVHRDVKPGNVLIAEDGTAKLTDFGISRATGDGTMTATGDIAGTPGFFAPEVARGEQATFASDVFSLGASLYNAVEGSPPFGTTENQIALLYRVASGEITPPANAGSLTPILLRLLQASPDARPDMPAVHQALTAVAAGSSTPTLPAATARAPEQPAPRRRSSRRALLGTLAAVTLIFAGALAIILPMTTKDNQPANAANPAPSTSNAQHTTATSTTRSSTTTTSSASLRGPEQTIMSYYALMPDDLRAGYAQLTERFKQARGQTFSQYRDFWQQFADVRVSNVTLQGQHEVAATITYVYPSGRKTTERHLYTLVRRDGGWAIDGQQIV